MLYFAIPTYNEAETIGVLLWRLRSVMATQGMEYEVLVYDDGSTDATRDVLEPYAQVLPLTVLRGTERRGTGAAYDRLAREAARRTRYPRRDAVVFLQGDFTDRPDDLPELLKRFAGGADLVVGERTEEELPAPVRRVRLAERWVVRRLVRVPDTRDLTSSLRIVRVSALRDALSARGSSPLATGDGAIAALDLLLALVPHARRLDLVPVTPRYDLRTRPSRRTGWPDAMALVKYAWANRGARAVAVQRVEPRAVEVIEPADEAEERPRRSSRPRDEDEARSERGREGRGGRSERGERARGPRAKGRRDEAAPTRGTGRAPATAVPTDRPPRAVAGVAGAATTDGSTDDETATESAAVERKRKRRRRRGERREREGVERAHAEGEASAEGEPHALGDQVADGADGAAPAGEESPDAAERRRTRKRRRRKKRSADGAAAAGEAEGDAFDGPSEAAEGADDGAEGADGTPEESGTEEGRAARAGRRRRRGRGGRSRRSGERGESGEAPATDGGDGAAAFERGSDDGSGRSDDGESAEGTGDGAEARERRRRRRRRRPRRAEGGSAEGGADDGGAPSPGPGSDEG